MQSCLPKRVRRFATRLQNRQEPQKHLNSGIPLQLHLLTSRKTFSARSSPPMLHRSEWTASRKCLGPKRGGHKEAWGGNLRQAAHLELKAWVAWAWQCFQSHHIVSQAL